jgi:putative ABC transport system ATP-binding protein
MIISFNNITPAPLAGVIDLKTEIWNNNLEFKKGIKYKVFAPSGKGKSTFINIIYGLRNDFTGEVRIDGKETRTIRSEEWADLRQKNLSIVFQDLRLFLDLSAIDNIHVKTVLCEDNQTEKLLTMAEALGVEPLLGKKTRNLSYGERQRFAIIRALLQPFDILLLDEPFSHLDKENIRKASEIINKEVSERNAGMIVTSLGHDDYFHYDKQLQL